MVILDTNIIIDHLRQKTSGRSILRQLSHDNPKETLAVSIISITELYQGKITLKKETEKDMLAVISPLKILPFTYEIAHLAGCFIRDRIADEFADAAIGATAIVNQASLYTLNTRDFASIPDLDLYK